jgi:hypothetical protein
MSAHRMAHSMTWFWDAACGGKLGQGFVYDKRPNSCADVADCGALARITLDLKA